MIKEDIFANREPDFFSLQVSAAQRFYRDLNPDLNAGLTVVAGGREQCAPGYYINRRNFPFYSIEFVVGGKGQLTLDDKVFSLDAGNVFAYGPGIPHVIRNHQHAPLEKFFLDFVGRDAEGLLRRCGLLGHVVHAVSPATLLRTFEELIHYGLQHSHSSNEICAVLTRLLILKISETALAVHEARSPAFATYQRCRNWVNDRYMSISSLWEFADMCHLDAAYLCRLFKRFDQQTPYQYLLRLRMNHATELLLTPGTLVKEVAEKLGFDDAFHFSRTFKKVLGISPGHFAKMHQ